MWSRDRPTGSQGVKELGYRVTEGQGMSSVCCENSEVKRSFSNSESDKVIHRAVVER